ncbi:hypothetical protein [Methylobacterium sp. Leaf123]|uniref:hypothetical protein n=1 Tax=Methylobacterium sp. Leaf123 TaxID=1736264 RepID=UPI001AEBACAF|nr:hypothetical protein [Methylobacterium sp. Leaf123]
MFLAYRAQNAPPAAHLVGMAHGEAGSGSGGDRTCVHEESEPSDRPVGDPR